MNLAPVANAFPQKIRVIYVHSITGSIIGSNKVYPDELPASFNKPTTISWQNIEWRVMKAYPVHSREFIIDNKLTLHIQEKALLDPGKLGFDTPTLCDDLPALVMRPSYQDFVTDITKEQWKQLELLPVSLLPAIQEEIIKVGSILFPGDNTNTLEGYRTRYMRKNSLISPLCIPANEFYQLVGASEKGAIRFDNTGFIENGFSFKSDNYTYYGKLNAEKIEELCLETFDSVDEEFYRLSLAYNLMLVDWCNGKIIMV